MELKMVDEGVRMLESELPSISQADGEWLVQRSALMRETEEGHCEHLIRLSAEDEKDMASLPEGIVPLVKEAVRWGARWLLVDSPRLTKIEAPQPVIAQGVAQLSLFA